MKQQNIIALSILLQFFLGLYLSLLFVEINFFLDKVREQDEKLINPQKNEIAELYVDV